MELIICKLKEKGGGWYEIAKVGSWKGHEAGQFELKTKDLKQIVSNFKNANIDIVVDYEHQTLSGNEAPAAGWIKELKVEDDALLAHIEWIKKAKEQIKAKEYRYLSPTLIRNAKDTKSGNFIGWYLHSVALTNTPFFQELPPIAAKNQQKGEDVSKEKLEELQKQIKKQQEQIDSLTKENKELKTVAAKQQVEEAIAAKKLDKAQEKWALNYALSNEKGFEEFLKDAKPTTQIPSSDQFAASHKPSDIDVVKLALGE